MASHEEFEDSNRGFPCAFCQNVCRSSEEMQSHLVQCANKTDQCPKCENFVRRAIFTYHYENNCSNIDLDETDFDRKTSTNFDESFELQQGLNRYKDDFDRNSTTEMRFNERQYDFPSQSRSAAITTSQPSELDFVKCCHCNDLKRLKDLASHQSGCEKNPSRGFLF